MDHASVKFALARVSLAPREAVDVQPERLPAIRLVKGPGLIEAERPSLR
jgi:hypothetical protein